MKARHHSYIRHLCPPQPLIREPLAVRRQLLKDSFQVVEDSFQWAKAWDADNVDKIQEFLDESIKGMVLLD